jgi:hypothetical protein
MKICRKNLVKLLSVLRKAWQVFFYKVELTWKELMELLGIEKISVGV